MTTLSPLLIPRPHRVIDKVVEVERTDDHADIVTLLLQPVDGPVLPFRPAQVGMVGAFGVGEAAISISSATDQPEHHGYTIRRAGPITAALVDTPIGGTVTVRGPFGTAWPTDRLSDGDLVIVCGGLGIAPLRAAIEEVAAIRRRSMPPQFDGPHSGRTILIYGAKTPDQLVYRRDLERWRDAGIEVLTVVDRGAAGWTGPVGLVTDLLTGTSAVDLSWAETSAFVCGPDVMMSNTAAALERLGVADDRIWLTLERNMQCGNALCGHCQLGPFIICRDGPVVDYRTIAPFHAVAEL